MALGDRQRGCRGVLAAGRLWDRAEAEALLGKDHGGILHRDRWRAYEACCKVPSQLCQAHLRREFQALAEPPRPSRALAIVRRPAYPFHHWHQFQDGQLTRHAFLKALLPVQWAFYEGLERARDHPGYSRAATNLGEDLLRQWDALWMFAFVEGVEPAKNDAERTLRKAVIWRKTSLSAHSEAGSRFVVADPHPGRDGTAQGPIHPGRADPKYALTCFQHRLSHPPEPRAGALTIVEGLGELGPQPFNGPYGRPVGTWVDVYPTPMAA